MFLACDKCAIAYNSRSPCAHSWMIAQERDRAREKAWHTRSLRSPFNSWGRGRTTHWHTDTVTQTTMLLLRQLITARISVRERERERASHSADSTTSLFRAVNMLCCFCCASVVTLTYRYEASWRLCSHLCFGCCCCCWLPTLLSPAIWLCLCLCWCRCLGASFTAASSLARAVGRSVGFRIYS